MALECVVEHLNHLGIVAEQASWEEWNRESE